MKAVECDIPATEHNAALYPPNGPYFCGDELIVTCVSGHEPNGYALIECTKSGDFDRELPPCPATGKYFHFSCITHLFQFNVKTPLLKKFVL